MELLHLYVADSWWNQADYLLLDLSLTKEHGLDINRYPDLQLG